MHQRDKFVTVWGEPDELVAMAVGRVTFRRWLELERQRPSKNGEQDLAIITHPNGRQIALARK